MRQKYSKTRRSVAKIRSQDPEGEGEELQQPMKYPIPVVDMSAASMAKRLTIAELEFFQANMDIDSNEWQEIAMAITIQQQEQEE